MIELVRLILILLLNVWGFFVRGVIEALKEVSGEFAKNAAWIPPDYYDPARYLVMVLAVIELIAGWILMSFLTTFLVRLAIVR